MRIFVAAALVLAMLAPPASGVGPQVVERKLSNGATLLVSEQHALPIVLVLGVLDAGSRRDPVDRFGVANMTADVLTEGTSTRSAQEIAEAIEFIGGSLSAGAGVETATVSLRVLRKDLDTGIDLFADVLLRPAFPELELDRAREATIAGLRAEEDNPTAVANRVFGHELYGDHPYAHPVAGDAESVARIDRAAVRAFYKANYGPTGSAIVVVGDIDAADVERRLNGALATWKGGSASPIELQPAPQPRARRVDVARSVTQASIVLGHRGVARSDPDFEAISVMNYVLGGGGFSSRLMEKIRNQAGLVYSVSSYFSGGQLRGSFRVTMQTKNESVEQAIALTRAEIEKMVAEGVGAEELADAKRFLTGSFPLSLDSNGEIASFIARSWSQGLGLDAADQYLRKIEAVTVEDLQRVAKTYLHPGALLEVVVAAGVKANEP